MTKVNRKDKLVASAIVGSGAAVLTGVQMATAVATFIPMASKVLVVAATGIIYAAATYGSISLLEDLEDIREEFGRRKLQ